MAAVRPQRVTRHAAVLMGVSNLPVVGPGFPLEPLFHRAEGGAAFRVVRFPVSAPAVVTSQDVPGDGLKPIVPSSFCHMCVPERLRTLRLRAAIVVVLALIIPFWQV